ncbi:MAG: ABC transporter ATP-binding protein [Kurthia sp.]|nr:ABC transporter ATP-binding protein [Candidatus Kurthia equi]
MANNQAAVAPNRHGRPNGPAEKPKQQKKTLLRIWSYVKQYKITLWFVTLCIILSSLLTVYTPYLLGQIVDDYIIPKDIDGTIQHVIYLAAMYFVISIFTWVQTYLMIRISMKTIQTIRQELFERFQVLPLSFFDKNSTGDLMSRVTNDVDNLNTALSQSIVQMISSVLTIIGTAIAMFYLSWQLALVSLIIIPVMFYFSKAIIKRSGKNYAKRQKDLGAMNGHIEENITGSEIVTLFGQEHEKIDEFNVLNKNYQKSALKAEVTSSILGPSNNFLNNIGLSLVIGVGAIMTVAGASTVGVIASFTTYSRQFFRPINQISNLLNTLQSAIAGAERVFEILDVESEFKEDARKKNLEKIDGHVIFENVSFGYDDKQMILNNISLEAKPGQMIAVVGPTGSGKTTIIKLLSRFYTAQKGEILINNEPITSYRIGDVRKRVSVVLQDTYLFSGTIAENIRFGRPEATDEEVIEAAKIARAHHFIKYLPEQYESYVVAGGTNLSQGQRQLIAISRAILEDADLLILDEATSSVDTRTEVLIQEGLNELMAGKTSFVIAHRLKTIEAADQILVLDGGKIIERGSHKELLAKNGYYAKLQMQVKT